MMRTLQDLSIEFDRVRGLPGCDTAEVSVLLKAVDGDLRALRNYPNPPQWLIDRAWSALMLIVKLIDAIKAVSDQKALSELNAEKQLAVDDSKKNREQEKVNMERLRAAKRAVILAFNRIDRKPCLQPAQRRTRRRTSKQ